MKQQTARFRAARIRNVSAGFTLIEVMVVVAVVAILAAIAIPSYSDYVRRGQLPDAFNRMSDYRAKMEQYYQDHRNYGTAADACASAASGWNTFPTTVDRFTYGCVASGATFQSYVITATGNGAVAGHVYTINQNGARTTTTFKGTAVTNKNCWLTKSTADC